MTIEYKNQKSYTLGIEGRTVTGIFAVHGHVDDGDAWSSRDRSHPGVFGDFKDRGRSRVVFLWQHQSDEPPIAVINELNELSRADLPAIVLDYAPDATGGTAVKRTYLETTRGSDVLAGITAGAITEMSYAYEVKRWDMEKAADGAPHAIPTRNIYEATLFDCSDVCWGMNPVTSADGSKQLPLHIEQQTARAAVISYTQRLEALHALRVVKEGRRFSAATLNEIEEAVATLQSATTRLKSLIAVPESEADGKTLRRKTQDIYQEWQTIQRRLIQLGVPPV